jgi:hypothetical protein
MALVSAHGRRKSRSVDNDMVTVQDLGSPKLHRAQGRHRDRAGSRAGHSRQRAQHSSTAYDTWDSLPYRVRLALYKCPYKVRLRAHMYRQGVVGGGLVQQSPLPPCTAVCWQHAGGWHGGMQALARCRLDPGIV